MLDERVQAVADAEGVVERGDGPDGQETFLLCRSMDRREKEKAMHARFAKRIEERLEKLGRRIERWHARLESVGDGEFEDGLGQIDGDRRMLLHDGSSFPELSGSKATLALDAARVAGGVHPMTAADAAQFQAVAVRGSVGRTPIGRGLASAAGAAQLSA